MTHSTGLNGQSMHSGRPLRCPHTHRIQWQYVLQLYQTYICLKAEILALHCPLVASIVRHMAGGSEAVQRYPCCRGYCNVDICWQESYLTVVGSATTCSFYAENCSFLSVLSYFTAYCICDSAVSLYHVIVCVHKFRHVFLVEKCRLWGTWDVEWVVRVDDIMAVPHIADKKLVFKVRQVSQWNTHMLWILS
jgi:hypothetical protein